MVAENEHTTRGGYGVVVAENEHAAEVRAAAQLPVPLGQDYVSIIVLVSFINMKVCIFLV